jgi:phosphate-selective porin OprO/OprP
VAAEPDLIEQLQRRIEALEKKNGIPKSLPAEPLPDTAPVEDRLKELLRRVEALEQLGNEAKSSGQAPTPENSKSTEKKPDTAIADKKDTGKDWVEVGKDRKLAASWDNGLWFATADDAFRFHVGGRFDFDNTWYHVDPNLHFGTSNSTTLEDGADFRRLRLRAEGRLWETIEFVTELNFANIQDVSNESATTSIGSVGITDVWLQFREVPWLGTVRIGHLKDPLGLERMTSTNYDYYMERSPGYDAFLNPFDYSDGIMIFNCWLDDRVTGAVSVSRSGQKTVSSFGFGNGDGLYAVTGRVTALPLYEADGRTLVHLGIGFSHRTPDNKSFDVGDRPLVRGGGGSQEMPNVMQTGPFFTSDGGNVLDAEFALVCGRFAMSAEYMLAFAEHTFGAYDGVSFTDPRGAATFQGCYVEAGWFLTPGDYRRYDRKQGVWARNEPVENAFLVRGEDGHKQWGIGAWQLVARYSYLDLVSGDPVFTPSAGARAGREQDITIGLNWYLNSQTEFMINYVFTHIDSVAPGLSGNFQGLGCRFHLDF